MPSYFDAKKEIELLRKENSEIKKRLANLENNGVSSEEDSVEEENDDKSNKSEEENKNSGSSLQVVGLIIGILLSITGVGAIIGIPLIIICIISLSNKSKNKVNKKPQSKKEKAELGKTNKKEDKSSFEEDIGIKWFARIGILALVIGMGFFIKYAIDNNWINHLTRILLGSLLGIILVAAGELISRKDIYKNWGKTLVGGGIAITYFMIYAAYHFPEYRVAIGISQITDIFLLSAVAIFALILALKDDSKIIAAESFFLGYYTSLLSISYDFMTIIYCLILTLVLIITVVYKKWKVLGLGGIIASYIVYSMWNSNYADSFFLKSFILAAFFIAFTIQTLALIKQKELMQENAVITLINSIAFFLFMYFLLDQFYPKLLGTFTFSLGLFYVLIYLLSKALGEDNSSTLPLYLAIFYLTIFIPIQFNKEIITIIWAFLLMVISILSVKFNNNPLRYSTYALSLVVLIKTLFFDTYSLNGLDLSNLINSTRLISFIATIIAFYVIYLIFKNTDSIASDEKSVAKLYSIAASALMIIILFLEFGKYTLSVTLVLAIISIIFYLLSDEKYEELIYHSLSISIVLLLKVLLYDSWKLSEFSLMDIFSSTRAISFIIAIATFYLLSILYSSQEDKKETVRSYLSKVYSYFATGLLFLLVLLELKEFWISLGWILIALVLILIGFVSNSKHLRIQGILIFSITIFKVFIYDIRNLETIYRTISYMVLGAILLLVSFIYTKYKDKIKEIL